MTREEIIALAKQRGASAYTNRLARQGQSELTGVLGPGSEAN